ncbi:hypothetical protein GCM10023321_59000 [Pseudonocardia eucalypti]|uniref:Transcription regulator PadR N-terminal domain-containing protein n=1 Tax=Pseudonocardia eucalypti TaxID=648755 RepID=A0ABP9QTF0_9PSEU|nr:DNA-binding PadR family transcriptional regulator [Pseudonocardia eucalypti]
MPDDARARELEALLLTALAAGPAHGYALMVALRRHDISVTRVDGGTLYRALRGLEDDGLIAGTWIEGPGRRRREYQLTRRGRRCLVDHPGRWRTLVADLSGVVAPAGVRPSWNPS